MGNRLKTNNITELKLIELENFLSFSSKAAVMRLAVGVAMKDYGISLVKEQSNAQGQKSGGQDYLKSTILGEDEYIYKILFESIANKSLTDDEFFPKLFNIYLTKGVDILYSEYRYTKNKNKLFYNLMNETREF